mgnify:CR=1 FL=1
MKLRSIQIQSWFELITRFLIPFRNATHHDFELCVALGFAQVAWMHSLLDIGRWTFCKFAWSRYICFFVRIVVYYHLIFWFCVFIYKLCWFCSNIIVKDFWGGWFWRFYELLFWMNVFSSCISHLNFIHIFDRMSSFLHGRCSRGLLINLLVFSWFNITQCYFISSIHIF